MLQLQGIICAICQGFMDSFKGVKVLLDMDKSINEKLFQQPSSSKEIHGKEIVVATHSARHFNQSRYC